MSNHQIEPTIELTETELEIIEGGGNLDFGTVDWATKNAAKDSRFQKREALGL